MLTGLYFGSFNPIHIGHLAIANYMVEFGGLTELWFVVSPQSPHKQKISMLPDYQRLHLLNLAIGNYHKFKACDIEFRMPKPNYTIDTLTYLSDKYPKRLFTLIMGADNLVSLHKWKNYEQIIEQYKIIVYPRPGFDTKNIVKYPNITVLNAPNIEISSSFIRQAIAQGHNLQFFVPQNTWNYIDQMGFYK